MLGEFLKTKRQQSAWTQKEMAAKLSISSVYLSGIETGKFRPGPKVIRSVARLFKLDVREVVSMTSENIK